MKKYELVTIVDAQKSADKKELIHKQVSEAISKSNGKIINSQLWLDKYKMAFSIKKCSEGTYFLTKFESAASAIRAIKQALRLNEDILRFAIYQSE